MTSSLETLRIVPKGADPESFIPHIANRSRKAKVPVLLINATCLNTGHRFVFGSDVVPKPKKQAPDFSFTPETTPPAKYASSKRKQHDISRKQASPSLHKSFKVQGQFRTKPSVTGMDTDEESVTSCPRARTLHVNESYTASADTFDIRYWAFNGVGGWCGEIIDPKFSSVAQLPPVKFKYLSPEARGQISISKAVAASGL